MGNGESGVMDAQLEQAKGAWRRLRQYVSDVLVEFRRTTKPGKQEVYGTTVMVVLTTFLFGIYFYICDLVFSRVVTVMLNYFRHRG